MLQHSSTRQHQTKNMVATLLHFPNHPSHRSPSVEQPRLATTLSALYDWHRLIAGPQTTRRALYWKFLPNHTEPQPQAATLELALHRLVQPCSTVTPFTKVHQLQAAASALSNPAATRPEATQEGLDLLLASANRLHQNGKLLQQTLYSELKKQRQPGETGWQPRREGYWVVASNLSRDLDRDLVKLFSDYATRCAQADNEANKAGFLQNVFLRLRPALAVAADLLNQLLLGGYTWDTPAFVLAVAVFIELVLLVNLVLAWWAALADDCKSNPPQPGSSVRPTLFTWSPATQPSLFQPLAKTLAQSELDGLNELVGWLESCPVC